MKAGASSLSRPCPACGAEGRLLHRVPDLNRQLSPAVFDYFRCTACRLVFLADVPSDLDAYYPSDYYSLADGPQAMALARARQRYKLDIVRRFVSGGRLIEIGPGRGDFCALAKAAGFEVTAIERSEHCRRFLAEELGVSTIAAEDEYAALERPPHADAIVMWQVIEHLADPWRFLRCAADKLSERGILVVATPNPDCFQFRLFGRRWAHLDAPRHLNLIPAPLLAECLASAGLHEVLRTTVDPGSIECNRFGWAFSLANFLRGRTARSLGWALGRLVAASVTPLEALEGRGAAYTVVFRRM
jgi:2-polyprenyl-3-methyl-5-hydroxy-6-metoxy-1,4-benzoquinol methylase